VLKSRTTSDPSGRLTIVETDDRGEPEQAGSVYTGDFRGMANYQELISIPLTRDDQARRGSARLGLFLFSSNVNPGLVAVDYLLLDCIVYGYLASAATVIKRMAFGVGSPDDLLRLDDSNNYDAIGVAGREIINGVPSSLGTVQSLTLTVVGRVSR
jgi:hypothetical protein